MNIRLLKGDQPIDISFMKVGDTFEAEYQWDVGEQYTQEIDTSTLDGVGVSLRLPGTPEAPRRIADESEAEDPNFKSGPKNRGRSGNWRQMRVAFPN